MRKKYGNLEVIYYDFQITFRPLTLQGIGGKDILRLKLDLGRWLRGGLQDEQEEKEKSPRSVGATKVP